MRGLLLGVVTCVSDVLLVLWPQDRSENEVEKVKGTLMLCYGHVAARAPRELLLARAESDVLRNVFRCFSTKVGVGQCWAGAGPAPHGVTRLTFCCSGSGNKGRDQGTVCRS